MSRGCDGGYGAPYTWLSDHCTQGKILALDSIHTISSYFQKFEGGGFESVQLIKTMKILVMKPRFPALIPQRWTWVAHPLVVAVLLMVLVADGCLTIASSRF